MWFCFENFTILILKHLVMKVSARTPKIIVETICLLFIVLFVYAALSKLLDFENFQAQLGQSPLLSAYTGIISYGVPLLELLLSVLLFFPTTKRVALYASFSLMVAFSSYIYLILHYSTYIPCSCGGVLEKMNWNQHFLFNLTFVVLALLALFINHTGDVSAFHGLGISIFKPVIYISLLCLFSVVGTVLLYVQSEDIMARENPFIRHYRQGLVRHVSKVDLNNYSFYFAGATDSVIYLGNSKAPLQMVQYDTLLKERTLVTIRLDRDDLPFRTLYLRVKAPSFYVFDGTVPVIYKGALGDWQAAIIMNMNHYYSKAEVIGIDSIAFISRDRHTKENVLGIFTFKNGIEVRFNKGILQRQLDGIFDTDGIILPAQKKTGFLYIYSYRNQYTNVGSNIEVLSRGNTIDTTRHAIIKPVRIEATGEYKLASQPYTVNRKAALAGNLLFVNSGARGRFEDAEMWKTASIIDVYNVHSLRYIASFYLYDLEDDKLSDFYIVNSNLYAIIGHRLQKYSIDKEFLERLSRRSNNNYSIGR
jgi:hypothetical protein